MCQHIGMIRHADTAGHGGLLEAASVDEIYNPAMLPLCIRPQKPTKDARSSTAQSHTAHQFSNRGSAVACKAQINIRKSRNVHMDLKTVTLTPFFSVVGVANLGNGQRILHGEHGQQHCAVCVAWSKIRLIPTA